ncbi:MAG: hypothetical protein K6B40_07075 [Firmicutes bacterium]|nr:hypothetical protein [Bacillota bacterium]
MKNKKCNIKTLLLIVLAILALLSGCARTATDAGETDGETDAGIDNIANPWTESDQQGVLEATGFSLTAPEGAANIRYSYLAKSQLAQMRYLRNGAEWVYRIQSTDKLTDISGMEFEWLSQEEGAVAGKEAMYYAWSDREPDSQYVDGASGVQVVNWYDAVSGVTYSLSAAGNDLNGMDMQVFAEEIYVPLQEDAAGDADAEQGEEIDAYFLGEHIRNNDGSVLNIAEKEDGAFAVDVSIYRLCSLENGVGTFADHKITFTVEDPSGNPMTGVIYRDSGNSLSLQITDSTWELLPSGEVIDGFEK